MSESGSGPADPLVERHMEGLIGRMRRRPSLPRTVGRYRLGEVIGRGGMGTVLVAHDEQLDRKVALKLLNADLGRHHSRRLLREAQALARLAHPNIVHVYEVGEDGGRWFIAMELVEGRTLRQWQRGRPDWTECVEVYLQVGQGLAAAHAEGLVHRDFKPDNCIIDDQGRARVLDFGLVRGDPLAPFEGPRQGEPRAAHEAGDSLTHTGTLLGTPGYMSLEQLGGGVAGPASDQFSFCVSLYEAIHGERPYAGRSPAEQLVAVMAERVRPVPPGVEIPPRLRRVLRRGLAADPERRWPSMDRLLLELRRLRAPRWRRVVVPALMVGVAAVAVGVALRPEPVVACGDEGDRLLAAWGAERKASVRAAMASTELPYVEGTWAHVEATLDEHAWAWADSAADACEAGIARGLEAIAPRVDCLERVRVGLETAVDVISSREPVVVARAIEVVDGLTHPSVCDDVDALRREPRVPPDQAPVLAKAQARLTAASVEHRAGRDDVAWTRLEEATAILEDASVGPLHARAARVRGELLASSDQLDQAELALREALSLASRWRWWDEVREAALGLARVQGRRSRPVEALQHRELVRGLADGDDRAEARVSDALAEILEGAGRFEEAEVEHRRALAMRRAALGPEHPQVVRTLGRLASCLRARGAHEEARRTVRLARALGKVTLGDSHPWVVELPSNVEPG